MKKIIASVLPVIALLMSGCAEDTTTANSKEMLAYNSLSDDDQKRIEVSPTNSTVKKIDVKDALVKAIESDYAKDKAYEIVFLDSKTNKQGNVVVYLDDRGKEVIGQGSLAK